MQKKHVAVISFLIVALIGSSVLNFYFFRRYHRISGRNDHLREWAQGNSTLLQEAMQKRSQLETWLENNETMLEEAIEEKEQIQNWLTGNKTVLSNLRENYTELSNNYTSLKQDYTQLSNEYELLFNEFNESLESFNHPLAYEVVPTTQEVEEWLDVDKTNDIEYDDPDFLCGDYAVMLSQHAKLENWDMGVVVVQGYNENHTSVAHAFNAIICEEGLIYIEPQTDEVWWYQGHEPINEEVKTEIPGLGYIHVKYY
ncbi:MAG: hypothetical protein ACOC6H_03110, partial [Thermoproteota archaeon]